MFTGRTDAEAEAPTLWPPDMKSQLIGKDPVAGEDWRQEEKGAPASTISWPATRRHLRNFPNKIATIRNHPNAFFMRDVLNGQITHRDKSLVGFSICCQRNSICLRLDMFAAQTRDLSHIELARSDNISSSSGWGSPKRRMSFGGSQRSENISSGRSSHIDRKKKRSKNRRLYILLSLLFLFVKGFRRIYTLHFAKYST